jgi:hypothetical protein
MPSYRLAGVIAAVVVLPLSIVVLCGCGSVPRPPTGVAGAPSVAAGNVHLTDYAVNTDGPASTVILTGAIGDYGTGETVTTSGSPDPQHTGQLRLTLQHGSFRLDTATLNSRLVAALRHFPADVHTCSGSVTVGGTVPVVAGSGTGTYNHLSGAFDLTVTVDEVDASPCDSTGAFIEQTIIMTGPGTVSLS